jgi:hypothetical protein
MALQAGAQSQRFTIMGWQMEGVLALDEMGGPRAWKTFPGMPSEELSSLDDIDKGLRKRCVKDSESEEVVIKWREILFPAGSRDFGSG